MNRFALPTLTILIAAASSQVMAQSSVTLYGVLDSGISYVNNVGAGSQVGFASGTLSGPRWGLKGTEDLGGGLAAIFQIENGFNTGTGTLNQGGREFGRQAFVGLASKQFGSLTLGRQYDPLTDLEQPITGDNYFGGSFAAPGDVDNNDNSLRFSNAIKYTSPVFYGLQAEGMYAMGGTAGSVTTGSAYSGALLYTLGGLNVAGGYLFVKNNQVTTAGAPTSVSDGWINDGFTQTSFATSLGSFQTAHVAASYGFDKFTVGARYSNSQYKPYATSAAFPDTAKFNVGSAYVNYMFTPSLSAALNYVYMKTSGVSDSKYNQLSAGVDYTLSKRTDIYGVAGYTKASGQTRVGGTLVPAGANVGDFAAGTSSFDKQFIATVGVRHKF
jgi:predicted porin